VINIRDLVCFLYGMDSIYTFRPLEMLSSWRIQLFKYLIFDYILINLDIFTNVSDIFLAFKYVWNILTAPFVARRVFLHLFLSRFFWIQPCPLLQTVQADGNSSSILFFVVLDSIYTFRSLEMLTSWRIQLFKYLIFDYILINLDIFNTCHGKRHVKL
jgi:MoaA/NifB/PqqE/SkfB family radical SAM enzyme